MQLFEGMLPRDNSTVQEATADLSLDTVTIRRISHLRGMKVNPLLLHHESEVTK